MNTKQTNKLAAYTAVEALLKATPEIADVTGLPEKLEALSARVAEINRLAVIQTQPIRASMAERDLVLDEMADEALELAGVITTLARDQNLPQLAESVEVGRRAFRRARRSHRLWFAQRVIDTARGVLPQLAPYGVTAETIEAFAARFTAAATGLTLPRSVAVEKKAATARLVALFRETDQLLDDQIGRLLFRLRKLHPEVLRHYAEARAIIDRRGARKPVVQPAETPAAGALEGRAA